jgi:hypothetical protein
MGEKRPEKGGGGRGRFCSYFVSALALVVGVASWSEGREGGGRGERDRERETERERQRERDRERERERDERKERVVTSRSNHSDKSSVS